MNGRSYARLQRIGYRFKPVPDGTSRQSSNHREFRNRK
jgi:hypothetical protein